MAAEENDHFNALPEGCIAYTLSLTSPRDACRLSSVSSTFCSAAQSDDVWESFLPPDYRDILSRSEQGIQLLPLYTSKKQLYLHLCDNPILIDNGTKSFSLEKSSGKKCYMLAARDLTIVWGDTPCYWQWIPLPMSRFTEVAELVSVCWLEIRGKIKTSLLSPDTTYASYLVFIWNDAFGFDHVPAEGEVGMSGEEGQKKAVHLDPETHRQQGMPRRQRGRFGHRQTATMRWREVRPADRDAQTSKQRSDGWMEVKLGEIFIKGGEDVDMEMALTEVKGGNWKRGLIVQGIEVRPK
ncbi:unnamed protein product [Coffea canephora]|uniref:F-box domain-containing protein n=2 Tax=Coffea TaxID=13442 RepID=A0A068U6U1_COFCA|nr:unnamed protein product [Coffea canephora]